MFQPLVLCRREPARDNPALSRYENTSGKHNKFWEVSSAGSRLTMHWGRIGTKGQTKTKSFSTAREATYAGLQMIEDKIEGGYHHVRAGQGAAARPVETKARAKATKKTAARKKPAKSTKKPAKKVAKKKAAKKPWVMPKAKKSRFASTRSPEFQEAIKRAAREIDALPRPKKHFMEGGDGVSGYGRIEVFGVHGAGKRGYRVSVGPDEWNAATQERAREIVENVLGPNAYFIMNID